MVSIRRRRLLGVSSGVRNVVVDPLAALLENENAAGNNDINPKSSDSHPMILDYDLNSLPTEVDDPLEGNGTPIVFGGSQLDVPNTQPNASDSSSPKEPTPEEPQVKRRKQHRRRNLEENHVPMRGVYSKKNSKWQAAIKVGKKQVHLGTVNSQDEAVHLYDRAAFLCGREPNNELSEEEKQELRKLTWDDFLATTRRSITTKRTRRNVRNPAEIQSSDNEGEQDMEPFSASDDAEVQN